MSEIYGLLSLIGVIATSVVIGYGYFLGGLMPNYSDGYRVGVISKFSRKGILMSSYEGELILGGIKVQATENGSVSGANIWAFSVTDKAVADRISKSMESGSAVRLKYKQWLIHPTQVDTSYNIVDVLPQR